MDDQDERRVCDFFSIDSLHTHQKEVLSTILRGKDVFLSTTTGSGKSLCYQAIPVLTEKLVLVISPLISIMKEQSEFLSALGIRSTYIGKDDEEKASIFKGDFSVVYACPERLLGEEMWRGLLLSDVYRQRLGAVVVDEAHTVLQWGEERHAESAFRGWFGKLGEIRSLCPDAPVMVLTATASKKNRLGICAKLCLKLPMEYIQCPDRPNIKLNVKLCNSNMDVADMMQWAISGLQEERNNFPRHVVFTRTIRECAALYNALRLQIPGLQHLYQMYHSCTLNRIKESITADMGSNTGQIRILICTNAAGMGVNFKGVSHVVNFGSPIELDTFVQQIGRAGRDGAYSDHILICTKRQLAKVDSDMKDYSLNNSACRRSHLMKNYTTTFSSDVKGHKCCDICSVNCVCDEADCLADQFRHAALLYSSTDSTSDEDTDDDITHDGDDTDSE